MEGHRNVAHSPCSTVAQLFLSLDRQSRVGAVSWQTPTGTSLLCSGLIGCPRALGAAEGSWPILHQCMLKINMKEWYPSRSLLPLSVLSMNFLPCCSLPPQCLRPPLPSSLAAEDSSSQDTQSPGAQQAAWSLPIAPSCCGGWGGAGDPAQSPTPSAPHMSWPWQKQQTPLCPNWVLESLGAVQQWLQTVEGCCGVSRTFEDRQACFSFLCRSL